MSNQLVITSGAKVRSLNGVITGTTGVLDSLPINAANGIPQLDSSGKILVSQLPNSVMEYQGTWNANTNTPTLTNGGAFNQGDVYLCNVAGTTDFGAGPIAFVVGDQVIYSGSIWQRASGSTGTVTSVAVTESGDALSITGSPITTSGTINIGFAGTSAQYVAGNGALVTFPTIISSIGLTMPSAFTVSNSPLTANGTIAVTGAGFASQYIRGDGTLADFPTSGGGGSSVSYYLNGGTNQGTIGGTTYYEMSRTADTGTGVDFAKSGDGLIVSFLTDANDPAQLNIPGGNWNYEIYASMSANGGTPQLYAELYKYNGTTFTLISTSSNEILYDGVNLNLYSFAMTVPSTTLAITDRLAIKLYATNSGGKTTTVHTQDSHLCQIITTFSTGITALNGLTTQVQYFATGTSGTDFNISSTTATHTFNLPTASATNRGALSSADWTTFNAKQNALTLTTTGTSGAATLVGSTLNIPQYQAAGTYVTSVTGTSPIVSSGGTTPAISITQATTSTNGYLSSTDWNTFNGKQNALTNPITGTGVSGQVAYWNGTTTHAGSNNLKFDGTNLSIGNPSSPLAQLHVYNASAAATILLQTNSTTDYSEIAVRNDSSTATSYFRQYSTAATGSDFGISRAGLALFFSNYATNFAIGTRNGGSLIWGTADTERMRITSAGLVGIGTASPGSLLTVNGDVSIGYNNSFILGGSPYRYKIYRSNAGSLETYFDDEYDISSTALNFRFRTSGTPITALRIVSTGAATFSSSVTSTIANGYFLSAISATTSEIYARIGNNSSFFSIGCESSTGGTIVGGSSAYAAVLSQYQNNPLQLATNNLVRLTITGAGNVGIGTTSPSYKLDTYGTSGTTSLRVRDGNLTATAQILLECANTFSGTSQAFISGVGTNGGNNSIDLLFGTASGGGSATERMRITSGGNVGIGTSSPGVALEVNGNIRSIPTYNNTSATLPNLVVSSGGTFERSTTSSKRYKENIIEWNDSGLSTILALKPVTFTYKADYYKNPDLVMLGLIAEEVAEVSPFLAEYENEDRTGQVENVRYANIVVPLIKAIQEQQQQIEELKAKING